MLPSRSLLLRIGIFLLVLYTFTALPEINAVVSTFSGALPLSDAFLLFVQLPYLHFVYSEPTLSLALLAVNIVLTSAYITLIIDRVSERRSTHIAYGISSSLLAVISIGCVACGSLLSPLAIIAGLGLPLSMLSGIGITFGVLAALLLSIGIITLYRTNSAARI